MNRQQCCEYTLPNALFPLWRQPFEIFLYHPWQSPSVSVSQTRYWSIFCKSGYSCTWGINITLSFAPLSFAPCFFRKVCNKFRFIQNNLTVDVFSMIMKELKLRTCWLLDGNLTVFGHSGLYGQNSFLSLYGI